MTYLRILALLSTICALFTSIWMGITFIQAQEADDLHHRHQQRAAHQRALQEAHIGQLHAQLDSLQGRMEKMDGPLPADILQAELEKCAADMILPAPMIEMNCLRKDPGICELRLSLDVPDDLAAFRFLRHLEQVIGPLLIIKSLDLRFHPSGQFPSKRMLFMLEGFWLCPVEKITS